MTAVLDGPADTSAMRIVHTALRRDFARARTSLTTWPHPADEQRVAIAQRLQWLMEFLHKHHEGEDNGLYPLVRARNPAAVELLDAMDAEHQVVGPTIDGLAAAAREYAESASAREKVVAALDALTDALLPHLRREESEMMPVVSATITEAEWRDWDQRCNVKPLKGADLAFTGLFILDGLEGADRATIEALVPAIPRWVINNIFIRGYRRTAFRSWRLPQHSDLKLPTSGGATVDIAAAPDVVWRILTDVTRVSEWSHECRKVRWLDGATRGGVGVRFRGANEAGKFNWSRVCTITRFDQAAEFAFSTDGGIYGDNTLWSFRLEAIPSGTRLTQAFQVLNMPKWFDRVIWNFLPAHRDRSAALASDLGRLAQLAEETELADTRRLARDPRTQQSA